MNTEVKRDKFSQEVIKAFKDHNKVGERKEDIYIDEEIKELMFDYEESTDTTETMLKIGSYCTGDYDKFKVAVEELADALAYRAHTNNIEYMLEFGRITEEEAKEIKYTGAKRYYYSDALNTIVEAVSMYRDSISKKDLKLFTGEIK